MSVFYSSAESSNLGKILTRGKFFTYAERKAYGSHNEKGSEKKVCNVINAKCQSEVSDTDEKQLHQNDSLRKKHAGFRDRKFIAYENRIRAYSTPDKIFRYFATLKSIEEDSETVYMTPEDFLRSITPGIKQPDGLDLDSFKRYDPKTGLVWFHNKSEKLNLDIPKESVFYKLCDQALITFTDFIFLLTVLSTPRRQFEIAFRMFDINGDGELDINEFEVVRSVIMGTTAMGRRHRDNLTTGCTLKSGSCNSAFKRYFFGPNGDQKLPISKFLQFHSDLQEEIMRLEFERAEPKNGKITEVQFANSLLVYAGFSENKRRKMIRRVKTKFPIDSDQSIGITYKDFSDFSHLLRSIADVDTALTFYHMARASINQDTLNHVASTVANLHLSPHVLDVVFTLFDENNDGQLSYREFVGVMRHRLLRGLDKPMDTGFVRLLSAVFHCTKEQISLGINSTYKGV
ncbi:unnamed protein product [Schistosoma rodhaini]|uniref:EF-hand domain-containing protein n=1 Tax=Schistosoma rodhaini TaxID=6188 RepID=A0AA85EM16_9TREM|nr:unnamed protein product [Schistosoma rodhaini]